MITGEIKNKIDNIWDTFWTGGITNSISVLEQMTYLFFMKMLDDAQRKKEAVAATWGMELEDAVFPKGAVKQGDVFVFLQHKSDPSFEISLLII